MNEISSATLRVAVIGLSDSVFLERFLQRLTSRRLRVRNLILRHRTLRERFSLLRKLARVNGLVEASRLIPSLVGSHLSETWKRSRLLASAQRVAEDVYICNSWDELDGAFAKQGFDLVVLAHSGLVPAPTLHSWSAPVVNAHPGRLHDWRGVDVIRWCLLVGEQPYCSLHLVEPGIDTGPVLRERLVPVRPGMSGREIDDVARDLCISLLVDAVAGDFSTASSFGEKTKLGPLRKKMPHSLARRVDSMLFSFDSSRDGAETYN